MAVLICLVGFVALVGQRPTQDEVIASGRTDRDARLPVAPQAPTTERVRVHSHTEETGVREPEVTTRRMREVLPDIYLRVTLANGRQIDTRHVFGLGLMMNQTGGHIGKREQPIVLFSTPGAVSDPDPHTPPATG